MAAFNKFHPFVEALAHGVHDLSTHTLKAALTNTAPVAANNVLANVTEITAGNGYLAGGMEIDVVTSAQTAGNYTLVATDEVLTAVGGTIGPFRYVVLYNDTPVAPADPLIGWFDYGSSITLNDAETFTIDFSTNVLSIT